MQVLDVEPMQVFQEEERAQGGISSRASPASDLLGLDAALWSSIASGSPRKHHRNFSIAFLVHLN